MNDERPSKRFRKITAAAAVMIGAFMILVATLLSKKERINFGVLLSGVSLVAIGAAVFPRRQAGAPE